MTTTEEMMQGLAPDAIEMRAAELLAALKLHADERYTAFEPQRNFTGDEIPRQGTGYMHVGAAVFTCSKSDLYSGYRFACMRSDGATNPRVFVDDYEAETVLGWLIMGQTCICGQCQTPFCEHYQAVAL